MAGMGRTVGIVMLAAGLLICLLAAVFFGSGIAGGRVTAPGAILGFGLIFVVAVIPLGGAGAYLFVRGRREAAQYEEAKKEKMILNMVLTQGQVRVSDLVFELQAPRDQVEDWIRDLVGKGLFSGAINWQDGILYSKQASLLKADRKCPNCGGEVELAGKGVVKCPWCGSEIFLSSDV